MKNEHEELKAMFWVLKNQGKTKSEDLFHTIPKIETPLGATSPDKMSSNSNNQNLVKRPARLLPYRVLMKYGLYNATLNLVD